MKFITISCFHLLPSKGWGKVLTDKIWYITDCIYWRALNLNNYHCLFLGRITTTFPKCQSFNLFLHNNQLFNHYQDQHGKSNSYWIKSCWTGLTNYIFLGYFNHSTEFWKQYKYTFYQMYLSKMYERNYKLQE